ncbi:MAG TPA: hypothetical protein VGP18_10655 [Solirubrobacteraceae bacterium]|nr:hypothetical protein [Solirubrobacteraceae bacterium]
MAPRRINLSAVVLASVALSVAGCGGGSVNPGVARLSSGTSSAASSNASAGASAGSPEAAALAFAACMRANGLPNFPDPKTGGDFLFHTGSGADPSSPAFKTAQTKCKKFLPQGPDSGAPPSAKTLAHYLTVAQCMRRRGVPEFPDPRTTAPSNPRAALGSEGGVISDIEGVIFIFPGRIDQQSPAFTLTAAECAFPLHNH